MSVALLDVPGIRNQPPRLLVQFVRLMRNAGADPALVGAVIGFESAWDPRARNPLSGAVGLIQWTNTGARSQGLEREQIAKMSAGQQLQLVGRWYSRFNTAGWRDADYYLAIFAPAALRKPLGAAVYSAPSAAYTQNAAMDVDGNGVITVGDIVGRFGGFVSHARTKPAVIVRDERWPYWLAAAGSVAIAAGAYYAERRRWL